MKTSCVPSRLSRLTSHPSLAPHHSVFKIIVKTTMKRISRLYIFTFLSLFSVAIPHFHPFIDSYFVPPLASLPLHSIFFPSVCSCPSISSHTFHIPSLSLLTLLSHISFPFTSHPIPFFSSLRFNPQISSFYFKCCPRSFSTPHSSEKTTLKFAVSLPCLHLSYSLSPHSFSTLHLSNTSPHTKIIMKSSSSPLTSISFTPLPSPLPRSTTPPPRY